MRLSPVSPYLPKYPGPYQVGTTEIEVPVPLELQRRFGGNTVKTLLVRLFYPTDATSRRGGASRPRWTGSGNYTVQGYAKFLGIRESVLRAVSYLGLKWTEIPAVSDAPLLPSPQQRKWPAMLFSHGLGGTRNAYSQVSGSIASGGLVVMAIEHRDNSAAISVIKTNPTGKGEGVEEEEVVEYISIKESTPSNIQKRRDQLSQRAYEMRLGIELFKSLANQDPSSLFDVSTAQHFGSFKDAIDVASGQFIVGGHSFGAATAVDVCKDSTTRLDSIDPATYRFQNEFRASILLDLWTEVLIDSNTRPLTLPALSIASEAFQKWTTNASAVKTLMRLPHTTSSNQQVLRRTCWIKGSAHLSQSDFQLLFPLATKYAFSAAIDPSVAMQLNVRAIREFLRLLDIGNEPKDDTIFKSEPLLVVLPSNDDIDNTT